MLAKRVFATAICVAAACVAARGEAPVHRNDGVRGALSDRVIAVAASHGRYYEKEFDRWEWQRGRLHGTVEDLFSASFVYPFLTPMLENAGAYVVMPRERDTSSVELVIDADGRFAVDGYEELAARHADKKHRWADSERAGFGYVANPLTQGHNPFAAGGARVTRATADADRAVGAQWSAAVPRTGEYAVYVSYQSLPESCREVHYTVHTAAGPVEYTVDQRMGGGTWVYLGTLPFEASRTPEPLVELTSLSEAEGVVSADAVKIGGGMGNVARGQGTSGMPRYAEAARYWLQWAGMPDSVYANDGTGDYRDDIFCRPMWVNYLKDELGVPVDLMLSFHTDAGLTELSTETVGTMGIFYTNKGRKFADGRSRLLNRALADSVVSRVTRDVRALHDPNWTRRKMRDRSYIEIRIPEVPSMLIELLSHQNYGDMVHGLNPQFKFDVSRAVYKGILAYMASQRQARYVVQPLPVKNFAISRDWHSASPSRLTLSWEPTADPLEPTAGAVAYRVEERIGEADRPFRLLAETTEPRLEVDIVPGQIHSYRVVAVNAGGRSFPSEVLSAGYSVKSANDWITVVNGFTRVAGPDATYSGSLAGFGLRGDAGVPWGTDCFATGRTYEFDRTAPWVDDDNPGFGASGWELECKAVSGNTFDFTVTHGEAILAAGRSFVSSSAGAFVADSLGTPPAVVDLLLGLQRECFTADMQRRLSALAARGTGLIVSGAYVGGDVDNDASTKAFAAQTLGMAPRGPVHGAPDGVSEVPSGFFDTFAGGHFSLATAADAEPYRVSGAYAVTVASGAPAEVVMRYDVSGMPAAVALRRVSHSAVTLGFPLETVMRADARHMLMNQMLKFLDNR